MEGLEKRRMQRDKGRLNARERITALLERDSFSEYGALTEGSHSGAEAALPGDGLVGGIDGIDGRSVILFADNFIVKGAAIGHHNAAKWTRLVRLALE